MNENEYKNFKINEDDSEMKKKDHETQIDKVEILRELNEGDEEIRNLYKIFFRTTTKMSNYKKLDKMYDEYADDEDISKREIKDGCSRFNLFFMLYIMFLIFGVINLIGIFESITMLNIMSQISKNSVIHYFKSLRKDPKDIQKFSVNDFNNNYNFYYLFFEDIKKDAFDFNLMMFFGFFGGILLNAIGFIWTTGICLVINGIALVLIYIFSFFDYDIKDNTFPLLKIFAIISFWILLSIGTGGSALLSQYILVYINFKYNDKISKFNKKTQDSIEKNKEIYKSKRTKTNEISEARESLKKKTVLEIKQINQEAKIIVLIHYS